MITRFLRMAMSRLSLTITAPIVLIGTLAIGLTVFLNVGKLDRTLGELEQSRLHFILDNLRENLLTGLDLGLPVRGLDNAQAAIEREARQDPAIVAIRVLDDAGTPVFATGGGSGSASDTDSGAMRSTLVNNLGVTAGAIELRYARRGHEQFIAAFTRQLRLAAAVIAGAAALLAVAGIRLWVNRIGRTIGSIEHTLDQGQPAPRRPDRAAAALAARVNDSAAGALQELDRAEHAITSADVAGERL